MTSTGTTRPAARPADAAIGVAAVARPWRGPVAFGAMVAAMLDTMTPGLGLVPVTAWLALELGLAIAVAVPVRGTRRCTATAAHRALGLIVMATLTAAMGAASAAAAGAAGAAGADARGMAGMDGSALLPVALTAAAGYAAWSLWQAVRERDGRLEAAACGASVVVMAILALL